MLKISTMTGKLDGFQSINTNPLSNPFCNRTSQIKGSICSKCYSQKMLKTFRKSCLSAFEHNSFELSRPIPWDDLPRVNQAYFRFHSHGELQNMDHLSNFFTICKKNPDTQFSLWTKRLDLILRCLVHEERNKPDNLNLIFSNPYINNPMPPPSFFDKVFSVYTPDFIKENPEIKINCKQKCIDCLECYKKNKIKVINELLKGERET